MPLAPRGRLCASKRDAVAGWVPVQLRGTTEIACLAEADTERAPATKEILRTVRASQACRLHMHLVYVADKVFVTAPQVPFRFGSGAMS